ncbi:hypothetical protein K443DRAFT_645538, partial [Laccaria amethystina LaAM-08-1]
RSHSTAQHFVTCPVGARNPVLRSVNVSAQDSVAHLPYSKTSSRLVYPETHLNVPISNLRSHGNPLPEAQKHLKWRSSICFVNNDRALFILGKAEWGTGGGQTIGGMKFWLALSPVTWPANSISPNVYGSSPSSNFNAVDGLGD